MKTDYQDSDISFIQIFDTLWNKKWMIIIISLLISILSVLVNGLLIEKSSNTNLIINSLPETKFIDYQYYNQMIRGDVTAALGSMSSEYLIIDNKKIFSSFIQNLNERTVFIDSIKKYNYIDRSKFSSEKSFEEAVLNEAYKIKISQSMINDEDTFVDITYSTKDIKAYKSILLAALNDAKENTRIELINNFNKMMVNQNKIHERKIKMISKEINTLKEDYLKYTKKRIAYLKEQAATARELEIEDKNLEGDTFINTVNSSENLVVRRLDYLQGYKAIETEIRLMEEREDDYIFTEGLIEKERMLENLMQDNFLQELQFAFEKLPLINSENFTIINNQPLNVYSNNNNNTFQLIIITFLAGMLITSLVILIQNSYTNYKSDLKT